MGVDYRSWFASGRAFLRGFVSNLLWLIPAAVDLAAILYRNFIRPHLPADLAPLDLDLPTGWFWWLFWGGVAVATFWTFHTVRVRKDELEARLTPRLEIVFGGDERPYLQERRVQHEQSGEEFLERVYRVGVRNLSDAVIPGVRVVLEDCDPGRQLIYPEHMLGVMDVALLPGRADVAPGVHPTAFFDIVMESVALATNAAPDISIMYLAAGARQTPLPFNEYRFTLRAEGGGAAIRKVLVVRKLDYLTRLVMREG